MPITINLKQLLQFILPKGDKLYAFLLLSNIDGRVKEIGRVPYRLHKDNEAQSLLNRRSALHKIKTITQEIGGTLSNLDEFEPECPSCRSDLLTEDVPGDLCCHNCGEEGPISMFYVGGIDSAYLNHTSQRTPQ